MTGKKMENEEQRHYTAVFHACVLRATHLPLPVFMYESIEGHAVFPAGGEVCDVDIGIPENQQAQVVGDLISRTVLCQCAVAALILSMQLNLTSAMGIQARVQNQYGVWCA